MQQQQQQQQQQGGSQYGLPPPPPDMSLFSTPPSSAAQQHQQTVGGAAAAAESVLPISVRPPQPPQQFSATANQEELGTAEDSLCPEEDAGGLGGASGSGGNRWPRQETLALLKIRSDMDATFRGATLKGPLWEEVCRKLGEMGYRRSAKKCKEKFENVQKYYKRSKEGRAGRQDGKSYRFFSQLEALHSTTVTSNSLFPASGTTTGTNTSAAALLNTGFSNQPQPVAAAAARLPNPKEVSAPTPIATAPPPHLLPMPMLVHELPSIGAAAAAAGISFSSNTSSDASESDEDDDEETEEGTSSGKKRKREGGWEGGGRKMMAFLEEMMRQVMERQEAMQQRFLEAIDRQEQDRAIREEAWRRQEMARIAREHEVAAGERATAVARNAALVSFLQKVTDQTALILPQTTSAAAAPAPAPVSIIQTPLPQAQPQAEQQQQLTPPPSQRQQQLPSPSPPQHQNTGMLCQHYDQTQQQTPPPPPPPPMHPTSSELVPISSPQDGGATVSMSLDPMSSRWPKPEIQVLIELRSGLNSRYQESGPKGPLWEEISAGMQRLGYNRSAKRCKEKWENINKYFKKVKERNKKRPEDTKTCPYFHQLDALYRSKVPGGGGSGVPALTQGPQEHSSTHLNPNPHPISVMPPLSQQQQSNQEETDIEKDDGRVTDTGAGGPSNVGMATAFYSDNSSNGDGNSASVNLKKPEDNVKELMGQPNNVYGRADEADSDNMEEDEDDEDDDEDGDKSPNTIQFQRPNVGGGNASGPTAASAPSSRGKAAAAGSFLAMVR